MIGLFNVCVVLGGALLPPGHILETSYILETLVSEYVRNMKVGTVVLHDESF